MPMNDSLSGQAPVRRDPIDVLARYSAPIFLVLLVIVFTALQPNFLHPLNVMNVLRQVSISGLIAIGMTFVILTGGIDLSVGSLVALTGLAAAYVSKGGLESRFAVGASAEAGNPVILAFLAAVAVGMACGALQGAAITRLRVPPFVVTLGGLTAWRGAALLLSGGGPISGFSAGLHLVGAGADRGRAGAGDHLRRRGGDRACGAAAYAVRAACLCGGRQRAGGGPERGQHPAGGVRGLCHHRLRLRARVVPALGAAELGGGGGGARARARRHRGGGDRGDLALRRRRAGSSGRWWGRC